MKKAFPLATSTWDDSEYEAIAQVVATNRFTMGPMVENFEKEFADFFGSEHAVMVNSGSSANLALVAAAVLDPRSDLSAGDEVLVPAVSWATTYYPLQQYGLILKFVDIDLDTLNMDLNLAVEAIGPKTKAIFAVNLLGNPNKFDDLLSIAKEHNLLLFEDNCESLGATFDGKFAGTFGQMGTFSSFFSHHISTMEGGVILTDDKQLSQMLVSLRAHGWTRELPDNNYVFDKSGDEFDDLFRFVLPGYNLRPLEMSGAIGIQQLKKVPEILSGRRLNASYFVDTFSDIPELKIQKEVGQSSWFGFSFVLEGKLSGRRKEVVSSLMREGIDCRPIVAGNFTKNPVMKHLNSIVPEHLEAADKVHVDGLFVGNHHFEIFEEIDLLHKVLTSVI